ncbi:hypothetical protein GQ55_8G026000 [Panicum hallii var. hallii]|uniref:Knottins-like domain-containing protein n=1 Tax=Panicum hallii var. hallii TaxID=1504633 RepID=A0A2T7CK06_9POAL|nr:hypothetical protein GQ55_8G026000 [Panicum hallii var. hallii]
MDPSPRNLSAVVFLLLVIGTAEMASVGAYTYCTHLSGSFHGLCVNDFYQCTDTCLAESPDNVDGACYDFPPRCYCVTECLNII